MAAGIPLSAFRFPLYLLCHDSSLGATVLLRLLLLFVVIPLVELALLFQVHTLVGGWWTFLLVLLTGAIGSWLARREGLRCWDRVRQKLEAGELPGDPLIDAVMILVAGVLLVTPGVLTDLLGFALLLPAFRRVIKRRLRRRFQARVKMYTTGGWPPSPGGPGTHDEIIDTHVIDAPPEDPAP